MLTIADRLHAARGGGAVAVDVEISRWLLLCTILLALFISLAKRRHELVLLADGATQHRPILGEYSPYLLDQMIAVVTASTLMAYVFYTISPETEAKFGTHWLGLTGSVSPVWHLSVPVPRAQTRGRRKSRGHAADGSAPADLRGAVGARRGPDHLPDITMPDFNVRSDSVNVEQIMEQIRARIREKRGVDYTEEQIRELAAVKLEKFLDPQRRPLGSPRYIQAHAAGV